MGIKAEEFGTKRLVTALGSAILYAAISLLLDPELSSYITSDGIFENFRPAIFFPAVVAVLYGPLVGAISAGLGNLLFDMTKNVVIQSSQLEFKHLIGFLANLLGGYVAGLLSKPASNASSLFELKGDAVNEVGDYFNMSYVQRLIRNTIASIIGLSFVTGLIIGYGRRLEPVFYPSASFDVAKSFGIFSSIAYANGMVLLISVPSVLVVFSLIDYRLDRKAAITLAERRTLNVDIPENFDFDIVSATSPVGDELWNLTWGAIKFIIKNASESAKVFVVRISSNDIFSPHRHQTPLLQPGSTDEMYFNVYGISSGEKKATMYVSADGEEEMEVDFSYVMASSSEIIVNKLMGIFLVVGLVISTLLVVFNIGRNFKFTRSTTMVLLSLPLELIIIAIVYWVANLRATDSILKTMKLRQSDVAQASTLVANIEERDFSNREQRINSLKFRSRIFLIIASVLFVASSLLVVARVVENDVLSFANDTIIAIIVILIAVLMISDRYLDEADDIEETILTQKQLEQKVIREAVSARAPEQFTTTRLTVKVNNPFETTGMRIYIHSVDNVTPRQVTFPDMGPDELRVLELDFTALDRGDRDLGFEFVQYRDEQGNIVVPPAAKTFDQESVKLKVSGTRVLGLSPSQIGLLRKMVAAIGAISLSISFLANLLKVQINQDTIETTIPLLVILQAPVVWIILYLQNRFQKSLTSED